jgi:hypothetical protein
MAPPVCWQTVFFMVGRQPPVVLLLAAMKSSTRQVRSAPNMFDMPVEKTRP